MSELKKHFIDEYKPKAEGSIFFGVPVKEMTTDELLAMIGFLGRERN